MGSQECDGRSVGIRSLFSVQWEDRKGLGDGSLKVSFGQQRGGCVGNERDVIEEDGQAVAGMSARSNGRWKEGGGHRDREWRKRTSI